MTLDDPNTRPPEDVQELDRALHRVRFSPRASLDPEVLGRLRRGEAPNWSHPVRGFRQLPLLVVGAAVGLVLMVVGLERKVTIDRCCYDLDGGGQPDDGLRVVAGRNGRVYRLSIYEDNDHSGTHTPGDVVRLDRTGGPLLQEDVPADMSTIRHCCEDLDGGGPPDDGIIVVGTPPDRVMTAALYELR